MSLTEWKLQQFVTHRRSHGLTKFLAPYFRFTMEKTGGICSLIVDCMMQKRQKCTLAYKNQFWVEKCILFCKDVHPHRYLFIVAFTCLQTNHNVKFLWNLNWSTSLVELQQGHVIPNNAFKSSTLVGFWFHQKLLI